MNICKVDDCKNKTIAKGYCNRHYRQFKRRGFVYNTFFDGNEIIDYKDGSIGIVLCNRQKEPIKITLVSKEYIDIIKNYRGYIHDRYACTSINKKSVFLHKFILPDEDKFVDHINGDTFDNRKENLRYCNKSQNAQNRVKKGKRNKSGVTGVSGDKNRNKGRSTIRYNGKNILIGRYNCLFEAIKERKKYEVKYFKEFAPMCSILRVVQDADGHRTPTLPSGKWPGGEEGSFTEDSDAEDILSIFYNGTDYYFMLTEDWK